MSGDYITNSEATKIRVCDDGVYGWFIDAVDDNGEYTEAVWTHYDDKPLDRDTAIAKAAEFASHIGRIDLANTVEVEEATISGNSPHTPAGATFVSLDGGDTYVEASQGVRIIHDLEFVPGEDGSGELHVNVTGEGMILDLWFGTRNLGTLSRTFDEVAQQMIDAE